MKAGARLAVYGAGLLMAFGAAFGLASLLVPDSVVTAWAEGTDMKSHDTTETHTEGGHSLDGLSLDADGFVLSPIQAPGTVDTDGVLSFQILDDAGEPVTAFTTAHEKDLHLVVVRSDGAQFRHVHPVLDTGTGTWSIPWTWDAAGTYRVYADFTPAGDGVSGITLTRAVQVAGDFSPVQTTVRTVDEVDGYAVSVAGHLTAGSSSELTISVARDGEAITTLQPYLGAFGHLVALREGDLAYLHVHAEGEEPRPGDTAGPQVDFAVEAPTAGRYLLYLDFQVDGTVHTAEFVLDAEPAEDSDTGHEPAGH